MTETGIPGTKSTVIGNGRVVTPEGILDSAWIEIDGDTITKVGTSARTDIDHDLAGRLVVPGFVDIHCHGGGGASYTSADHGDIGSAAAFHRSHGTTTTLAGLISAPPDVLERQLLVLRDAVRDGVVAGTYLEGPWLSPEKRGAHDPAALRLAAPAEVSRLLSLGEGTVRMVTLAPELPGGMEAITEIVGAGATAAVGHTTADYGTTLEAVRRGARVGTHLYNGMPSLHHRTPGPVAGLLEDSRVTIELVADGYHVHPAMLGLAIRAAGVDRVALVTDAMQAAGMPDGRYDLGGQTVRVDKGLVRLVEGDSIAGSTLTMDSAFRYVVQEVGVPIEHAARMAATNPARAVGLSGIGALRAGFQADLVVLDSSLVIEAVMARGQWIKD